MTTRTDLLTHLAHDLFTAGHIPSYNSHANSSLTLRTHRGHSIEIWVTHTSDGENLHYAILSPAGNTIRTGHCPLEAAAEELCEVTTNF